MGKMLKTSTSESVKLLSEMKRIGIESSNQIEAIKALSTASKYSGKSVMQVAQFAGSVTTALDSYGVDKSKSFNIGTAFMKGGGAELRFAETMKVINKPSALYSLVDKEGNYSKERMEKRLNADSLSDYLDVNLYGARNQASLLAGKSYAEIALFEEKIKKEVINNVSPYEFANLGISEKVRVAKIKNPGASNEAIMATIRREISPSELPLFNEAKKK